jgi:MerR family redox-sensitive transcriptional activator SoxR
MGQMSIGDVARQVKIRTSAIRYYEAIGLLPTAARVSGQRRYDESILVRLRVIAAAQHLGFTIAELQELFSRETADLPASSRWNELARRKMTQLDQLIERAHQMRDVLRESLRCGCIDFEDCEAIARDLR